MSYWSFNVDVFVREYGYQKPAERVKRIRRSDHIGVHMTLHSVTIADTTAVLWLHGKSSGWNENAARVAYRRMGGTGNLINSPITVGEAVSILSARPAAPLLRHLSP